MKDSKLVKRLRKVKLFDLFFGIYFKHEEVFNYLIVGGLTFLVSILSYYVLARLLNIEIMTSNVLSWVIAVIFAFFMNKIFVFKSKQKGNKLAKEVIEFVKFRILSLVIELVLIYITVKVLKFDDMIMKIIAQIIVILLNYIFSKFFIFKKD
jgi:Predicted membrane protein